MLVVTTPLPTWRVSFPVLEGPRGPLLDIT